VPVFTGGQLHGDSWGDKHRGAAAGTNSFEFTTDPPTLVTHDRFVPGCIRFGHQTAPVGSLQTVMAQPSGYDYPVSLRRMFTAYTISAHITLRTSTMSICAGARSSSPVSEPSAVGELGDGVSDRSGEQPSSGLADDVSSSSKHNGSEWNFCSWTPRFQRRRSKRACSRSRSPTRNSGSHRRSCGSSGRRSRASSINSVITASGANVSPRCCPYRCS